MTSPHLAADARRIWQAGVDSVRPEPLLRREVEVAGQTLRLADLEVDLRQFDRIVAVGGGKAGAGMAVGLELALGPQTIATKRLSGWINIPEGTHLPTEAIHLHPARPQGANEPRPAGVAGSRQILDIVTRLTSRDLCLCLLSGGGSALLPAPAAGVSLDDKIELARLAAAAGANIAQLNAIRRQLSDIKGGALLSACRAGLLVTLIISDVPGDPLPLIASGPTIPSDTGAEEALAALTELGLSDEPALRNVAQFLERRLERPITRRAATCEHHTLILANNATAVDAAGVEAERLGYQHAMISATKPEGPAEEVGEHLAHMAIEMRDHGGPNCLISGGEPTVALAPPAKRGMGGRNQQLALSALGVLRDSRGVCLLSGGTDGEDGPTDAAGAWIDNEVAARAGEARLVPSDFLRRNDAYHFFEQTGGLLKTGPTHTNVCDLRVVVIDRS